MTATTTTARPDIGAGVIIDGRVEIVVDRNATGTMIWTQPPYAYRLRSDHRDRYSRRPTARWKLADPATVTELLTPTPDPVVAAP